jgi:transcription initiation factor IIE alpha subunit
MSVKVMPYKHKGQDVFICTGSIQVLRTKKGCGFVVENLNPTTLFKEGYHFDVCPKCKSELDYNDLVKLERLILTKEDHEVLAKWAKEKFKS